jgi:hypothetical protein
LVGVFYVLGNWIYLFYTKTKRLNKKELNKYPKDWIIDELISLINDMEILDKEILELKQNKMKLGNIIYFVTKYTGIKYLVDSYHKYRGTECNCGKRRNKLNELKINRW